ncbi:MurR/RpiR family transcriptional regulator [Gracilibacillus oryzae]|uniref:MurR/RpiR family transcriptional regulator n=1 Tax=Gracilibacillus oryzae TaxID=1672701 RepID=A0A7C8GTS6_9BACI|nr:MurR/RpiR family transcriptional regulator [Gracilibacillus oryzae]KAB8137823.1 MurR/RpiR family transcriptional regulator [Gracilibacillus oryzae]
MRKSQTCLINIRTNYPRFSVTERKIADYILKHPQNIIHSSINQVAEDLNVAESTVFRFCKRIGYKGYQAMKIALASEVISSEENIHESVQQEDRVETIATKVFQSHIQTLRDTLEIIDEDRLDKAVNTLTSARNIHFFGSGGSNIVALDAYHKFIRTGLQVQAVQDTHLQLMAASQLTADDCAILISHSGTSKDIIHVLNIVRKSNVKTIAITNFAKSTLSETANLSLYTSSEETSYRSEAFSSRIAQLTIIDALYVSVLMKMEDKGQEALKKMREALLIKRL